MRKASPATVGAFVVGAVVILVALVAAIGSGSMFHKRYPFVLHFSGSVNGLREGAPVKFKGVHVGAVRSIKLPLGSGDPDMPIPVLIELEGRQLARTQDLSEPPEGLELDDEIRDGLRAQLVVESIVTGILFVSLDYRPDTPIVMRGERGGVPEIPTLGSDFDEMRGEASKLLAELKRIDFAGLVESSARAMAAVEETARAARGTATIAGETLEELSDEVRATAVRTREALGALQSVAETIERHAEPLATSLRSSSERLGALQGELEATLRSARMLLDPQAPIAVRLEAALGEIERAARSTRGLVEYLERNPSAVVRGAAAKEDR
jgi:paraquat-inducible protein B